MARVWHGTANAIYPANRLTRCSGTREMGDPRSGGGGGQPAPRSVTPGATLEFEYWGGQSNNRLFTTVSHLKGVESV